MLPAAGLGHALLEATPGYFDPAGVTVTVTLLLCYFDLLVYTV